jgi:D-aminopeptidase
MNRLLLAVLATTCATATTSAAQSPKPRARDLGIPQAGTPGPLNAITDVPGVEVGVTTVIRGDGKLVVGQGPVRTGVTAILPRGKSAASDVFAAWFTLNGNGEMTGTTWVEESGLLGGPVMITNTHSVGTVHRATIEYALRQHRAFDWSLPVVAETWDGGLNDINGFHVTTEHALAALESAKGGPVAEGNVGGGTGMTCNQFKGGTGTSSRRITVSGRPYTLGVLVQCNYGGRSRFSVAGVPVGEEIPDLTPCYAPLPDGSVAGRPACPTQSGGGAAPDGSASSETRQANQSGTGAATTSRESDPNQDQGSIIVVLATDAPLLPHQLKRVVKRAALGIGRMGGIGGNSSGDIFIAFSTANPNAAADTGLVQLTAIPQEAINPVFEAAIDATSEAILNAMLAAETMTGANGHRVFALPHDRLMAALRKYGRVR